VLFLDSLNTIKTGISARFYIACSPGGIALGFGWLIITKILIIFLYV